MLIKYKGNLSPAYISEGRDFKNYVIMKIILDDSLNTKEVVKKFIDRVGVFSEYTVSFLKLWTESLCPYSDKNHPLMNFFDVLLADKPRYRIKYRISGFFTHSPDGNQKFMTSHEKFLFSCVSYFMNENTDIDDVISTYFSYFGKPHNIDYLLRELMISAIQN